MSDLRKLKGKRQMPTCLHDIIVDYVTTQAYPSTARALAQRQQPTRRAVDDDDAAGSSKVTVSNGDGSGDVEMATADSGSNGVSNGTAAGVGVSDGDDSKMDGVEGFGIGIGIGGGTADADGDGEEEKGYELSEKDLEDIQRRRAIIDYILSGAIIRAIESLKTHFPAVLDVSRPTSPSAVPRPQHRPLHNAWGNGTPSSSSPGTMFNLHTGMTTSIPGHAHGGGPHSNSHTPPKMSWSSVAGSSSAPVATAGMTTLQNVASSSDHSTPVFVDSTHPSHVGLNLQIQQFIESFRQLAPSSPSSSTSSLASNSLTSSMYLPPPGSSSNSNGLSGVGMKPFSPTSPTGQEGTITGGGGGGSMAMSGSGMNTKVTLTNALTAAQGLHTEAKKLSPDVRTVYLQEIKDVGALFAYTDPENSILKGFLDQNRRILLAEQVNRAILKSQGRSVSSLLETFARRTTAVYALMDEMEVDPRPQSYKEPETGKEVLLAYWKHHVGPITHFTLREFVGQTW